MLTEQQIKCLRKHLRKKNLVMLTHGGISEVCGIRKYPHTLDQYIPEGTLCIFVRHCDFRADEVNFEDFKLLTDIPDEPSVMF